MQRALASARTVLFLVVFTALGWGCSSSSHDGTSSDAGAHPDVAADAGRADGSADGAMPLDAGTDSTLIDSGAQDGAGPDSPGTDGNPPDDGAMDSAADSSPPDVAAGDTLAPEDSGLPDAAPADTGQPDTAPADTAPADTAPADTAPSEVLTVTGVVFSATQGVPFSGTVANVVDSSSGDAASSLTATIQWGDGTSSAGTVSGSAGSFTVSGAHSYTASGSELVTVSVSNAAAAASGSSSLSVAILAQLKAAGSPFNATQGVAFGAPVATVMDANKGDPASALTAMISWGDGSHSAGTLFGNMGSFTVSGGHTYALSGPVTVTVTVTDASTMASTQLTFIVTVGGQLSVAGAMFSPTQSVSFGGTVATVADVKSSDPASALTATIDWGDGTQSVGTIAGGAGAFNVSGPHTYSVSGLFTIQVTVSDVATAAMASATFSVTVAPQLSVASTPFSPTQSVVFNGNVGHVSDAITSDLASSLTGTIAWGDGSTDTAVISGVGGSFTVSGSHTYVAAGLFTVKVTVTDPSTSATASSTSSVTVAPQLSVTGIAFAPSQNVVFNGPVAHLSDAVTSDLASTFTGTIAWGDGSTDTAVISGVSGSFTVSGSHLYAQPGMVTVRVTINDPSTLATGSSTTSATVGPQLLVTPTSFSPKAGVVFAGVVAHVTDALTSDLASSLTGVIDWGDGTTDTAVISGVSGSFSVSGSHTYVAAGTATVKVSISDPSTLGSASTSFSVTVSP